MAMAPTERTPLLPSSRTSDREAEAREVDSPATGKTNKLKGCCHFCITCCLPVAAPVLLFIWLLSRRHMHEIGHLSSPSRSTVHYFPPGGSHHAGERVASGALRSHKGRESIDYSHVPVDATHPATTTEHDWADDVYEAEASDLNETAGARVWQQSTTTASVMHHDENFHTDRWYGTHEHSQPARSGWHASPDAETHWPVEKRRPEHFSPSPSRREVAEKWASGDTAQAAYSRSHTSPVVDEGISSNHDLADDDSQISNKIALSEPTNVTANCSLELELSWFCGGVLSSAFSIESERIQSEIARYVPPWVHGVDLKFEDGHLYAKPQVQIASAREQALFGADPELRLRCTFESLLRSSKVQGTTKLLNEYSGGVCGASLGSARCTTSKHSEVSTHCDPDRDVLIHL